MRADRKRLVLAAAMLAMPLSGCLAFDQTWDNAAYQECRRNPNTDDRRSCVAAVDRTIEQRESRASATR